MSINLAFRDALSNFFGAAKNTSNTYTGATQTQIYAIPTGSTPAGPGQGYALVYGFTILASSQQSITLNIVDASATAAGGTVMWSTNSIPAGGINEDFMRPLGPFSSGIVLSLTATGTANVATNIQWSAVGNPAR